MFAELMKNRRSIRKYSDRPLEQEKLELILEAGRLAPSARNRQDWKFILVTDPEKLKHSVEIANGQSFVADAPAFLVVAGGKDHIMACKQSARTVDCSIAFTCMILQAEELGIGSCWLGNFDAAKAQKYFSIPDGYVPVAATPLGYPAEEPAARPRKQLSDVTITLGKK